MLFQRFRVICLIGFFCVRNAETSFLDLRQDARKAKNYAQADAIRNKLGELGIVIEDTPQGARWKKQ